MTGTNRRTLKTGISDPRAIALDPNAGIYLHGEMIGIIQKNGMGKESVI